MPTARPRNIAPSAPAMKTGAPSKPAYKAKGVLGAEINGVFGGNFPALCVGVYHDIYSDIYGCV